MDVNALDDARLILTKTACDEKYSLLKSAAAQTVTNTRKSQPPSYFVHQ